MPSAFVRAIVTDVLTNPAQKGNTRKTISEYAGKVAGDENLKHLPRNSVVVKILSNGESKTNGGDDGEVICYPFFSSHFSMPVKPGEEVWVMFEEYNPPGRSAIGYWISRIHGPRHVEDVNYAYNRRTYKTSTSSAVVKKRTSDKFSDRESGSMQSDAADSPKQLDSTESPTSNPTEMIDLIEYAKQVHRFDAIPRYTKRPGDFVMQGSNNSLIMLGEERGRTGLVELDKSESNDEVLVGKPAIDIVVGRKITSTAKTVLMELLNPEIDKRISPDESVNEGDANFADDAARIYITADSDNLTGPDALLSLKPPADITGPAVIDNQDMKVGSFFVAKADNLRLVSRKSIKILKEPTADDGAAIIMDENGSVQIASPKIFLTPYVSQEGSSFNLQPYIRLDKLSSFLNRMIDEHQSLVNTVSTLSSALSTFGAAATTFVPPAAALGTSAATEIANLTQRSATSIQFKGELSDGLNVNTLASTVIYGE